MRIFVFVYTLLVMPALAGAAGKPTKAEALALLKGHIAETRYVAGVLEDVGGRRFPVLFNLRGKDCLRREVDGREEKTCSTTSQPSVAVVKQGADGALSVEGWMKLPMEAAPWDMPEPMAWGIHFIEDYDADGKPELMLVWGYHGPLDWGVGDTAYRHWAILNLDPIAPAIHVVLDEKPQASVLPYVESKWKLLPPAKGAARDIRVERRAGSSEEGGAERVFKTTTTVFTHDKTTDRWVEKK